MNLVENLFIGEDDIWRKPCFNSMRCNFFKRKNGLCLHGLIYSNLDEGMFV